MKSGSFRECVNVAWPLVLAMAGNAIMMFVDRLFLARYSTVSIQAAMPAGLVAFMAIAFLQNVVAYSGTFVAQYAGAGSRAACARAMSQGLWLSTLCVPLLLASIPLGYWLFEMAGHAPEVQLEERSYYLSLVIGNLALPFAAAVSGFFSGRGFTRLVMVANLIGNVTNIVLDPIFIWGWGVIPEMGIVGAGVATAASQYLILAILTVALFREKHFATRRRRSVVLSWKSALMGRIVRFGTPSGSHVFLDVGTFTVFVFVAGRLDALSFATSNIALAINSLVFAPLMGIGLAANILTGQRMGDKDPEGATRVGWHCMILGWIYIALCVLVIGGFNTQILHSFYTADAPFSFEEYLHLGRWLIGIFLAWAVFDTCNIVLGGALKGVGDTKFVLFWIAGTAVVGWMPALLITYWLGGGILAMWTTMLAYVVVAGIGLWLRFILGGWKKIRLLGD